MAAALDKDKLEEICEAHKYDTTSFPFEYVGNGLFQLIDGKTFEFLHARVTTGDRGEDMVTGAKGSAGELWRAATDHSVTDYECAAWNCNNSKYKDGERHKAEVAAHVYSVTQGPDDPIEYMMLIPTCSACNNRWGTQRDGTCFPGNPGEYYLPLSTYPNSQVIFIQIGEKTQGGKGNAGLGPGGGKGSGKGQGGATGGGPGIGTKGAGKGSPKPAAGMTGRGRGVTGGGAKAPGKASPKPAAGKVKKAHLKK